MVSQLKKYRGIHPGIILNRELKKRSIKQRPFALQIGEHPQTFNAIIKGKRNIPIKLSLEIEKALKFNEGVFAMLQVYYEIEQEKAKSLKNTPNISIFRKSLFWDTDINKIDWQKQYIAVIGRVYERGNTKEQREIERFYGKEKIVKALNTKKTKQYAAL